MKSIENLEDHNNTTAQQHLSFNESNSIKPTPKKEDNDDKDQSLEKNGDNEDDKKTDKKSKDPSKKHKRRWLIILVFSILNFGNGIAFITFSPTIQQFEIYYNQGDWVILQLPMSFLYAFVALSFPCAWLVNKWFKRSLILAMVLQAVGGWVRYAAFQNFAGCLIGQILIALAQGFLLATPAYIGHTWFSGEECTVAILIGAFSNYLGTGFGFILPTFFINANQTPEVSARSIEWTLLVEAIILCIPLLPGIFVFKDRPESKPGSKEKKKENKQEEEVKSYWSYVWICATNWKLLASTVSFGDGYGLALTIQAVIASLLPPNFPLIKVGLTGLIFVGSGLIFGVIGELIIASGVVKGHYDFIIRIFFLVNSVVLIFIAIFMNPNSGDALIFVFNAIGGFGLIGFTPFGIQSLIETAHPAPENIPTNWMYWWGQLIGILGTYVSQAASAKFRLWTLVIILAPASIWVVFHKTDYKKNPRPNTKDKGKNPEKSKSHDQKKDVKEKKKIKTIEKSSV